MRYIFFDINGVLINGYKSDPEARVKWTKNLKRDLGIDPQRLTDVFFERTFPQVLLGKVDLMTSLEDILPELEHKGFARNLVNYWFEHDITVNPEVFAVIERLRQNPGKRLFIATNQEKYRANHLWDTVGFKKYFEEIYFSGRMGFLKTDHRFFDLIERDLSLEENQCLLVDDNPEVIAAATKAGWNTLLFKTPADLEAIFDL